MLKIGLTGGIGSGKTTVADCFASLGVPVIDADKIAHGLTTPGQPALQDIVSAFGRDILNDNGQLDRARLRAIVFNDAARRKQLEDILHPLIRAGMRRRIADIETSSTPYCILCIPLLLETGQTDLVDRILVVDTPEDLQYQRVSARNGLPDTEIAAIIHAQAGREQRLAAADDIIVNDGGLDELRQQVLELHQRYMKNSLNFL
ncbi:MAG: dephospho-CoA kinase [Gammaproteobacteria bacterium]|nr:dephospho-CoA kinase [Gammaproteobacteria bacterium]